MTIHGLVCFNMTFVTIVHFRKCRGNPKGVTKAAPPKEQKENVGGKSQTDGSEGKESDTDDGEEKYEVESILRKKWDRKENKDLYEFKWKDFPKSCNTWQPFEEVPVDCEWKLYDRNNVALCCSSHIFCKMLHIKLSYGGGFGIELL